MTISLDELDAATESTGIPLDQLESQAGVGVDLSALDQFAESKDRPITAAAAGAARGLSFGLSDLALTGSGLVEPETLSDLRTYNPNASLGGELGGAILPTLLSGGTTAPASVAGRAVQGTARVLSAPVRAVSAVGSAATKGLVGALGAKPLASGLQFAASAGRSAPALNSALESALAKKFVDEAAKTTAKNFIPTLAAKGVGSFVEGNFYGAGQVASAGDPVAHADFPGRGYLVPHQARKALTPCLPLLP